jgi:hypothetical protein
MKKILFVFMALALIFPLIISTVASADDHHITSASNDQIALKKYLKEKGIDINDPDIALKLRLDADLQMEKEISASISTPKSAVATLTWTNVPLGTDTTFYTADYGERASGHSGWVAGIWDSAYFTGTKKAEAVSYLVGGGWGNCYAWSYVGKDFSTSGGGSRAANIRFTNVEWYGLLMAGGSANCAVRVKVVLKDWTTGAISSATVLDESKGIAGLTYYDGWTNYALPVVLQSGHLYTAYIRVETSGGIYLAGGISSDFGTQDGDPGYTDYYSITVDF